MKTIYDFAEMKQMISPQLIYYPELIGQNIRQLIQDAGSAERLWPHVKTHKMAKVTEMLLEAGIDRFKCATFPEAEMTAEAGAKQVILAYPLVGPNIGRFLQLVKAFPGTVFYAIGDDTGQIRLLSEAASSAGVTVQLLIDVDMGQHRTGAPLEKIYDLYMEWDRLDGIHMAGMHCYDGHRHEHDYKERLAKAEETDTFIADVKKRLIAEGYDCGILVMGGSPSFPCHQALTGEYLSPGTCIIEDAGYKKEFPDLCYTPAAVILTRVISRPKENWFTLDMGTKAVASDPPHERAVIVGMEYARTKIHNEEHWTLEVPEEHIKDIPPVGTELFAIPTHICPTSALYPSVPTVTDGHLGEYWEVTARNRKRNI